MEKSRLSMEKSDLVQQINDQNTSISENKIEVEKQLQEAINQQKKENDGHSVTIKDLIPVFENL